MLAEKLCAIAPGNMGRVFFSNSGAEAVEAALKLARVATRKQRIIYASNSFHGKTLGALSVTGREKHREPYYPLIPGCTQVDFGDITALEKELADGNVAGFIIEPIQGEGGVIIPQDGYLSHAQDLCKRYNALFIVDEIQTGFGRTGKLFACEWENLDPDILVLAKSLSGGLIPIGATLSKAEIWDRAYGTMGKFLLHTSTFGGNNLAASAGLMAVETIINEKLSENAMEVGGYLKEELVKLSQQYPFVSEVRGKGLMLAIKFKNSFEGSIEAVAREIGSRLPGNWLQMYRFMSDQAINNMETTFEDLFCVKIVSKLSQEHNILTFMTANHNNVMRIQPPLILTRKEADRFVDAFRAVCEDMSTIL